MAEIKIPEINVALIGTKFMGKAHSNAYSAVTKFFPDCPRPRMRVICGRDRAAAEDIAARFGWESVETNWERVLERKDVDAVDICTPGYLHKSMAVAAAQAGKHVLCEKPLGNTGAEAREMLDAVTRAKVVHGIVFNYRRVPAVMLAKQLVESGRLGRIYHFRARYLQDWLVDPHSPRGWRMDKTKAGSGALGDLGAHIVDLCRYLVGEVAEVTAMLQTFIKERPLPAVETGGAWGNTAGTEMAPVTVDDAALFLAKIEGGVVGSFEATRFAAGRRNHNAFEVNGSKGSVAFNLERMNELEYYNREDPPEVRGFRTILATEPGHHAYAANWWPPGHIIGYEHTHTHIVYEFLKGVAKGESPQPNFFDGWRNNMILDAVERSAASGKWEVTS
ncbi:MAG: Gfo/Idh/MocA family oxidoreductase [Candidatus Acidiferrales bacterium]|jgi:predicted dehydrogenase